jgi:outer membrane protein TolC
MKPFFRAMPVALIGLAGLALSTAVQAETLSTAQALERWRAANQAVGEFPRGHIDLLRWEQAQSPATTNPTAIDPLKWPEVWRSIQRQRADWVLPPAANAFERRQAQHQWLRLQQQAQHAWANAITQQALLRVQAERVHAARTALSLGERMVALGHWSAARGIPVQLTSVQEAAAELALQAQAQAALEALADLMGLSGADDLASLAKRLPQQLDQPNTVTAPPNAEALALQQRPEMRWQSEAVAREIKAIGEGPWRTWAQARDALLQGQTDAPPQWPVGTVLGDHALNKALAARAAWEREQRALASTVRQAWQQLERARTLDLLMHEQRLPLQQQAEQETLLRYNGMLQSTWALIDAAQARLSAQADALQARRAHWLTHADWHTLMAGGDIELTSPPAPTNERGNAAQGH